MIALNVTEKKTSFYLSCVNVFLCQRNLKEYPFFFKLLICAFLSPFYSFSDIDLVVHGLWNQPHPLWTIKDELIKKKIADGNDIKVLDKAAVSTQAAFFHRISNMLSTKPMPFRFLSRCP